MTRSNSKLQLVNWHDATNACQNIESILTDIGDYINLDVLLT